MDSTFTSQARRALRLAADEARRFNCGHVSTEHLLLALLHEKAGPAARALARRGVDCLVVWREINRCSATGHTPGQVAELPRTPRMKLAINHAGEEARRLGPDAPVSTRELMLGLMNDPECVAAAALRKLGVPLDAVRREVRAEPSPREVQEAPSADSDASAESIRGPGDSDHVRGAPGCTLPGLALPPRRSLSRAGPLSRAWRFLLRLLKIKAGVAASRCADDPSAPPDDGQVAGRGQPGRARGRGEGTGRAV